ncbi:1,4-alpha-glucan branching enzyme/starch branching enzyme II [Phaffia rhodozyma]|uniref:1,4-alpha-glucan-branching enzyme n=1 Tax=Phaffia rhodozyma TaxID=264483 RepID=A0A0F7SQL6_PHARH|nr:1,4-alpha-glucan branching enzyme/starch branching enzyme II [Phaffia rhodozyma]
MSTNIARSRAKMTTTKADLSKEATPKVQPEIQPYEKPMKWFDGLVLVPGQNETRSLIDQDPDLENWDWYLNARFKHFQQSLEKLKTIYPGGLDEFSSGYLKMGLVLHDDNSITYTEWAEGIIEASLIGDFNAFNPSAHLLKHEIDEHTGSSYWTIHLPVMENGQPQIPLGSEVKIRITLPSGESLDRFPAWVLRATQSQNPPEVLFRARIERLPPIYNGARPLAPRTPKIYEAHIGAATSKPHAIGTFEEFEKNVLWRVKAGGYNTLQLMGIMEHPYYASYGYQVSSFFAVSSRFGSIASLTSLIDAAHKQGIRVILDVVHGHSCTNDMESLNMFNGTRGMYFSEDSKGDHPIWGTAVNQSWTGNYGQYFSSDTDHAGVEYFMLANHIIKTLFPFVTTIAEDTAGFPTLALSTDIGGLGFDYRLTLGPAYHLFHLLKTEPDDANWSVRDIVASLGNRRLQLGEKTIAFVESHDQCIEGGKTMSQWLFDDEIYTQMSVFQTPTPKVERAMALHKMLRLMVFAFAGEGYMNFMGNEFGHPEWLVFPSVQNGFHTTHCRRQWDLADFSRDLRYRDLARFDREMLEAEERGQWGSAELGHVWTQDEDSRLVVFTRANHLFIFNWNTKLPAKDDNLPIPEPWALEGQYRIELSTTSGVAGAVVNDLNKLILQPRSAVVISTLMELSA